MKKNQPTPDSPLHENPIDAFQINAAREFHRLTTGSRYPRKGNPRQTTTSAATAGETSAGASKRSTPTASASKNTGPGVASAKKPSPVPVPVPHVHTENATRGPACNNPLCAHCGQVIIPAPVATFPVQDTPSICINNEWFVLTQRLPILNAKEIDTFEDILDGLPVPEMIFGNNKVEVIQKHFHLMFNTLDALKLVQRNPENLIKVSYANEWFKTRQQKHKNSENVSLEVFRPYDWTYSSTYKGTVLKGAELWTSGLDGNYKIPVSKLSNDNPIKFYDDMILYEDELGDNGISILNVKIRVMSDCLLILQRLFIRVDDVLVKIIDTRVYIDFDDYLIIREQKQMESSYRDVLLKIPACPDPKKYLRDINWCSANLPIVETQREYINLPRE